MQSSGAGPPGSLPAPVPDFVSELLSSIADWLPIAIDLAGGVL